MEKPETDTEDYSRVYGTRGLVALFSPKEYTAGCTMVPQSGDKKVGGNLSGLASMVGINLGGASGGEVLSPTIYPKIVASIPFKKDLMATR